MSYLKKISAIPFLLFLFAAVFLLSGCSDEPEATKDGASITPKLGVNYAQYPSESAFQVPAKHEVLEFFSYSCIHCFRSQDALNQFIQTKPEGTNLIKVPVAFGGDSLFSQVFYTFEEMGVLDDLHSKFFNAIHIEKLPIRSSADFFAWMSDQGYPANQTRTVFNSSVVRLKTSRSEQLMNQYQINSTPSYVIDGKYRTGPGMSGSHENTMSLILQLVQQ